MFIFALLSAMFLSWTGPFGSMEKLLKPPYSRVLPHPQQLQDNINYRRLNSLRDMLKLTEETRKDFEKRTAGDYRESIRILKELEDDMKKRIEVLEKKRSVYQPYMPFSRPLPRQGVPIRD